MKITSFEPLIISAKADEVIATLEALGFERRHKKTGFDGQDISIVSMKNADGFRVTVAKVENMPRDITAIRMNVDSFEEAYAFLTARGFKNAQGDRVTELSQIPDHSCTFLILLVDERGAAVGRAVHAEEQDEAERPDVDEPAHGQPLLGDGLPEMEVSLMRYVNHEEQHEREDEQDPVRDVEAEVRERPVDDEREVEQPDGHHGHHAERRRLVAREKKRPNEQMTMVRSIWKMRQARESSSMPHFSRAHL